MSLEEWDQRYRRGEQAFETPSPLVERFAGALTPGRALDLASGPGRNALYLAGHGWKVRAIDGSPVAIETLLQRAEQRNLKIDALVADLEHGSFALEPEAYDLICDCYYLQRSLFSAMKAGLRSGGMLISIVHLADPDQPNGPPTRATPGELRGYFPDWTILHYYEGKPNESCHQRAVAELVAQKP